MYYYGFHKMNTRKKLAVLGCGWIGKVLVDTIDANKYDTVCLSRNIEENIKNNHYDCDTLLIAIPPRNNYLEVLTKTLEQINSHTQVILLSSISFYDGKPLVIEAEALVHSMHKESVVLRLGGLMGYDRIAGKYTAGKVLTSDSRTNYVHRDDVIGILERIIEKDIRDEVFDVIAPIQSTKKKVFTQNAKVFGFKETGFLQGDEVGKVLSPTKLCEALGYVFEKEDVRRFWD